MACDTPVEGAPGNKIGPFAADVVVPIGPAVVVLAAAPAGTRRVTVQNTSTGGNKTFRVREMGGALGTGYLIDSLQSVAFGGADGAVARLEVEGGAVAASVTQGFEGST